jgi:hypothetical protein
MTRQCTSFAPRVALLAVALVAVMIGQLLFAATKISAAVSRPDDTANLNTAPAARPATERPARTSFADARRNPAEILLLGRGR